MKCCYGLFIFGLTCLALGEAFVIVASSTEPNKEQSFYDNIKDVNRDSLDPQIYEMDISSNVTNRFAKTLITSKVKNPTARAQEATFFVILPEKAYISEFIMEIGGKTYKAYVKEKEEAQQIYNLAVSTGLSAAHVAVSARDSNRFTVSLNVGPEEKATFYLTYEELLERKKEKYELIINIHPGQIVKDLNINVNINETRPLKFVRTPSLRSGNEISKQNDGLEPNTEILNIDEKSAKVSFKPDSEQQKQFAEKLGTEKENGLSGQFVVEYDVERDPQGGEVLIKDGYFVHFFAPDGLQPMSKQVVFILDTSGSMSDGKLQQVKRAMESILDELKPEDAFNLIDFDTNVKIWNVDNGYRKEIIGSSRYEQLNAKLEDANVPGTVSATEGNIAKAKRIVKDLETRGSTNIIGALEAGLFVVRKEQEASNNKYQPLIIFLTDGSPNVGLYNTEDIIKEIGKQNVENKVPIFSLSFGDDADKSFLRKLSSQNLGFSRHIYYAADAYLQLQDFYHEISSPLLSNITFEYLDENIEQTTRSQFPIYFKGGEFIVAGRLRMDIIDPDFSPYVWANGNLGNRLQLSTQKNTSAVSLERLWAYLTIRQKLEEANVSENKKASEKDALDLALRYSFVTPVTSLVVVKPYDTSSVTTEDASRPRPAQSRPYYPRTGSSGVRPLSLSSHRGDAVSSAYSTRRRYRTRTRLSSTTRPTTTTSAFSTSTAASSTAASTYNALEDLKSQLPWLEDILMSNNVLKIKGGVYDLGLLQSPINRTRCTNENNIRSGYIISECHLLQECPRLYPKLVNVTAFEEYFCNLEGFAAVCCPISQMRF